MQGDTTVEFVVYADRALFSDPITRVGGEKLSYQVPTYSALEGILKSIYWKPTINWIVDKVRVMKPIQMKAAGVRLINMSGPQGDLAYYTYLRDVAYQVQAHFEWNMYQTGMAQDRNSRKHLEIAQRAIARGGYRDIFLGTRECQGYVEPCKFGEGVGAYDNTPAIDLGIMFHGTTFPDMAYDDRTKGNITSRFWCPTMNNGIIEFLRPEDCPLQKHVRPAELKVFPDRKQLAEEE